MSIQEEDDLLRRIVLNGGKIVFFGGAGVSTESGIPDFRSADGLYNQSSGTTYAPEEIISHSFYSSHPQEFFDYYRKHLIYPEAQPNPAHYALARLEQEGKLSAVVTQNIDGLHQKAGSRDVLELHGSVLRNNCERCGKQFGVDRVLVPAAADGVPRCDACGGTVKPDVVLYEEPLDQSIWQEAAAQVAAADTLIVGGTSLSVYPAAGLLQLFQGDNLVLINRDVTPYDGAASLVIHRPIGETLAQFM